MNKDAIQELMDLKQHISRTNVTPYVMKPIADRLNSIIIDLMEMGEGRDNETCCTCEDCPAMKKMDELELRAEIFKNLKVEVTTDENLEAVTTDENLEAEKMARGKRARGGAD